jgi:hypothetical protein
MVNTSTIFQDTIKFIRDDLSSNLTDPISSKRTSNEKFVMTSYPLRPVKYPIITIKEESIPEVRPLGLGSEMHWIEIPVEIRIWARNVSERSDLTDKLLQRLRSAEFDTYINQQLHNFTIKSIVDVDEINQDGYAGIRSRIVRISYKFILGS